LNQLSLPRLLNSELRQIPSLGRLIDLFERYRLKLHIVPLLTDAPTHVIMVVLEDKSGVAPRFSVGLKAHRSLEFAIEKAATEALRAHTSYRLNIASGKVWDATVPVEKIGHRERLYYWGVPKHSARLEFMIRGPEEIRTEKRVWEDDTESEHLHRITEWCVEKKLECVSVSLGTSKKNPTDLFIEMVVMPELQPTYLTEPTRAFGGTRWHTIPKQYGYRSLEEPFAAAPHPFS